MRLGLGGYSPEPVNGNESPLVSNMVYTREGIWRPRQGLVTLAAMGSSIVHVSQRPWKVVGFSGNRIVVMEGGNLRLVSHSTGVNTLLATGWGSSGHNPHCFGGNTATQLYWVAPKVTAGGAKGALSKINLSGTLSAVGGGSNSAIWVDSYGTYTMALDNENLYWSNASNTDTWAASGTLRTSREIGNATAFVQVSQNQAFIMGNEGIALFTGTDETNFSQRTLYGVGLMSPRVVLRVANEVFFLGAGNRLWKLSLSGLTRIEYPIAFATYGLSSANLDLWHDPQYNFLCLADAANARTYLYDLERGVWHGYWTASLIGCALIVLPDQAPNSRRVVGNGSNLQYFTDSVYTDGGSAFSCVIETAPSTMDAPEALKVMQRVWIDGQGTWTVTLYHRNTVGEPDTGWTAYNTSVTAPGYAYFDYSTFREFKLRLTATAASTVFLRGIQMQFAASQYPIAGQRGNINAFDLFPAGSPGTPPGGGGGTGKGGGATQFLPWGSDQV